MRNKDRFHEAFAHVRHKVMGRRLLDFKLYHRFWLEVMESPLVMGGDVSVVDLEMASLVCSCERDEIARVLEKGAGGWRSWRGWWFALRCLFLNIEKEADKWLGYMEDHVCGPSTHGGGKGDEPGGDYADFPATIDQVCGVIRGTGWDPNLVWHLGPGEAEWYMSGVFRHRGVDVGVKSEHDEEFEEGLRKRKEEEEKLKAEKDADDADDDEVDDE